MLGEYVRAAEVVESVDELEVTGAEDQVMAVGEEGMDLEQEAWDQDRGPDPAYDNSAP